MVSVISGCFLFSEVSLTYIRHILSCVNTTVSFYCAVATTVLLIFTLTFGNRALVKASVQQVTQERLNRPLVAPKQLAAGQEMSLDLTPHRCVPLTFLWMKSQACSVVELLPG